MTSASRQYVMACAAVVLTTSLFARQQQRDGAAAPTGSGEISGVVMSADAASGPIRHALVTIAGDTRARAVVTDDAGRFTFGSLPAGSFTVTASKAAYLSAPYGARRPGRTGSAIALEAGAHATITLTLFKGAVLTGVVRDGRGQPVSGVDVRAIDARTLLEIADNTGRTAPTDDRGVFRIYALQPADYFLIALPMANGREILARSETDLDSVLAALARGPAAAAPVDRGPGAALPPSSAPGRSRTIGFSPIYYPGTPYATEAVRVTAVAGEEHGGLDFLLTPVPVSSIEGVVDPGGLDLANVEVTLVPMSPRVSTQTNSANLSGRALDAQGAFTYANLPPGKYRVVARGRRGGTPAPAAPSSPAGGLFGAGRGSITPTASGRTAFDGEYLYGYADVDIRGDDVTGVGLALQPGGLISGRVVFKGADTTPRPADLSKITAAMALRGGWGMVSSGGLTMGTGLIASSVSIVRPDGTFEIRGIGPGRFAPAIALPADVAKSWFLRSVSAGDRDLLDDAVDIVPGTEIRNVTVTFSDAVTEINGSLQTGAGQITSAYYIVLMPADRALWQPKSRRIASTRPSTAGRFAFANIPAGDYIVAALDDLDVLDLGDPALLERLVGSGVRVVAHEGQKTTQNLRIGRVPPVRRQVRQVHGTN